MAAPLSLLAASGFDLASYERDLRRDSEEVARRLAVIANDLREAAADLRVPLLALQSVAAPVVVVHDTDSEPAVVIHDTDSESTSS